MRSDGACVPIGLVALPRAGYPGAFDPRGWLSGELSRGAAMRHVLLAIALLGYCFETLGYVASPLPSIVQGVTMAISSLILFGLILWLFRRSTPISRLHSEPA